MKNSFLAIAIVLTSLLSLPVFSQSKSDPVSLGLPGDDLDLYAVMDIFQKSKTIEGFEKSLNAEKGPNNLDLDKNKKVDFIKVITDKKDDSFTFVLQVAVSKTENQDVAVILVDKDKKGQVSMQIVGDEDLYGKDYVVEPKGTGSKDTVNPGYTGGGSETMNIPAEQATTTTVVVQSAPIVQYVYSPAYVPYYPPYYYGYYPPYYFPIVPIARAIFWANNFHCHGGYYGGYHGNVNINVNHVNHFNNYNNNSRNRSNTVNHNKANGSYGNRAATNNNRNSANRASTRPSGSTSNRPSASTRPSGSNSTRPSASTRPSTSPSTRPTSPSISPSTRQSGGSSNFSRPSSSNNSYSGASNRSSGGSSYSGGGRSGGSSFSGGGGRSGGGGMRGGGGRR